VVEWMSDGKYVAVWQMRPPTNNAASYP